MSFYSKNTMSAMKINNPPGKKQKVMNDLFKTGQERGFKKAAMAAGFTSGESIDLWVKANKR